MTPATPMRLRLTHGSWFAVTLLLILLSCSAALPQSPTLAECTRMFYRGDYAQAAELAGKHLRHFPKDAPAWVLLSRTDFAQGKFRESFDALRKALAADPKNVDALYYLSIVSRELSQREYERLYALAPDSARVHQLLGEAALAAQNPTEAETEFANALKANPHSVEVLTEMAELKRSQSKFDEAIIYYGRAAEIPPLTYDAAYGLGACYTYKQDYSQAIEWLRKAVALAPDSAGTHFALGNALFQSGQVEPAIPELNTALQLEPKLKQAYFLLGRAYSKLGRTQEARAALNKLDEINRAEVPGQDHASSNPAPAKPPSPE
jgi:tetratricopeptide (TPR) repeat protein